MAVSFTVVGVGEISRTPPARERFAVNEPSTSESTRTLPAPHSNSSSIIAVAAVEPAMTTQRTCRSVCERPSQLVVGIVKRWNPYCPALSRQSSPEPRSIAAHRQRLLTRPVLCRGLQGVIARPHRYTKCSARRLAEHLLLLQQGTPLVTSAYCRAERFLLAR